MDQVLAVAIIVLALIGLIAVVVILRKGSGPKESPFAASTEGEKRCPSCGMGNMWTNMACISCGADLPG